MFGTLFLTYGRIEWQRILKALERARDVAYDNVLRVSDKVWCVKGLIITRNNLVVSWKTRPRMGIITQCPVGSLVGCTYMLLKSIF